MGKKKAEKSETLNRLLNVASVAGAAVLGYFLAKKSDQYVTVDNVIDKDSEEKKELPDGTEVVLSFTVTKRKRPDRTSGGVSDDIVEPQVAQAEKPAIEETTAAAETADSSAGISTAGEGKA